MRKNTMPIDEACRCSHSHDVDAIVARIIENLGDKNCPLSAMRALARVIVAIGKGCDEVKPSQYRFTADMGSELIEREFEDIDRRLALN